MEFATHQDMTNRRDRLKRTSRQAFVMPFYETISPRNSGMAVIESASNERNRPSDPSPESERPSTSRLERRFVDVSRAIAQEREALFLRILSCAGAGELRRIRVVVGESTVSLIGLVSSYYNKQLAQETLRPYADGLQIDNRIDVVM
ncbi:MAG: hypothetical protein AAF802_20480 [Planctomycetota bacterium]